MNRPEDPPEAILDQVEGGLLLLLHAVKAGEPESEIIWRIQEEMRLIHRARQFGGLRSPKAETLTQVTV